MDHTILHSLAAPLGFITDTSWSDTYTWVSNIYGLFSNPGKWAFDLGVNLIAPDLKKTAEEYIMTWALSVPIAIVYIITALACAGLEWSLFTSIDNTVLQDAWEKSIYIINFLSIFILIFIAFANALKINLDTYAIKKTLPAFIIGLILANLSFLIAKFLLDFSDLLLQEIKGLFLLQGNSEIYTGSSLAAKILSTTMGFRFEDKDGIPWPSMQEKNFLNDIMLNTFLPKSKDIIPLPVPPGVGAIIWMILLLIILLIPAIFIFILSMICLARNIVLYILIAIMPIIIMLYFFPPTKQHGQKLLGEFFQWLFIGPAIYFILGLATLFDMSKDLITK